MEYKPRYRLAVFDLDGTLVNSINDLAAACEYVLAANGYPSNPPESYKKFVGNGTLKLIERALPAGTDEDEIKRVHAQFSERYRAHCLDLTKPYEGIAETLTALKNAGVACAVASNKPDEFANQIVTQLFGGGIFEIVRGKREGVPAKPSPDIINSIIDQSGVSPEQTVIIGDSDVDVMTAQNSSADCIGCVWGFRGEDELRRAGAKFLAHDPQQIADLILEAYK